MAAAPKIQDLQNALNEESLMLGVSFPRNYLVLLSGTLSLGPGSGKTEIFIKQIATMSSAIDADNDFDGWLLQQASALRERRYFSLNWDRLAEELEDMAALRRSPLKNDLAVVLEHMLKLAYEKQTTRRWSERQWKVHLAEHRDRINELPRGSGTLWAEFEIIKHEAYANARRRVGFVISPAQTPAGPEQCPWTTEQICNDNFFPVLQE